MTQRNSRQKRAGRGHNRCTFDDMAGWRYDDYAATYEPHAYIRYASSRGDINRVIARQIRAWDKQGLTGREISEAIEKCHAALERRAAI